MMLKFNGQQGSQLMARYKKQCEIHSAKNKTLGGDLLGFGYYAAIVAIAGMQNRYEVAYGFSSQDRLTVEKPHSNFRDWAEKLDLKFNRIFIEDHLAPPSFLANKTPQKLEFKSLGEILRAYNVINEGSGLLYPLFISQALNIKQMINHTEGKIRPICVSQTSTMPPVHGYSDISEFYREVRDASSPALVFLHDVYHFVTIRRMLEKERELDQYRKEVVAYAKDAIKLKKIVEAETALDFRLSFQELKLENAKLQKG